MNYQYGSTSEIVAAIQSSLGITADGKFGDNTKAALISFQKENGLTPDGIAGPLTLAKLLTPAAPVAIPSGMWKPTGKGPVTIIDMYHGDSVVSWPRLAAKAAAGIHKFSTGLTLPDPLAASRWPLFTKYNMRRGAYHWFMSADGAAQFDFFYSLIQAAGGLKQNDRILALDYEPPAVLASHIPQIKAWGDRCMAVTGRIPCFYSSKSSPLELANFGDTSFLKAWYFWEADPSDVVAVVETPFEFVALHQLAEQTFDGMQGSLVDVNTFPGSAEELDLL